MRKRLLAAVLMALPAGAPFGADEDGQPNQWGQGVGGCWGLKESATAKTVKPQVRALGPESEIRNWATDYFPANTRCSERLRSMKSQS